MNETVYDEAFFDANEIGSYRSARVVLGLAFPLLRPNSVLDVGCGLGTWLRAGRELGARELVGIDGDYIDTSRFHVDPASFAPADLSDSAALLSVIGGRRFDLTMCLETAEHLPAGSARAFVAALATTTDVVLWSAAIPGQGGTQHVNERPLTYWVSLWHEAGFQPVDSLRPGLQRTSIDVWYAQNAILFVRGERAKVLGARFDGFYRKTLGFVPPLAFVHPLAVSRWAGLPQEHVSRVLAEFADAFGALLGQEVGCQAEAIERLSFESDGALMWAGWKPRGTEGVQPSLLALSPDRMNLMIGLYYPTWSSAEEQTLAAQRRSAAAGLTWGAPTGYAISGWDELSNPQATFRLSISFLEGPPDRSSVIEAAIEAGRLWSAFFGKPDDITSVTTVLMP